MTSAEGNQTNKRFVALRFFLLLLLLFYYMSVSSCWTQCTNNDVLSGFYISAETKSSVEENQNQIPRLPMFFTQSMAVKYVLIPYNSFPQ